MNLALAGMMPSGCQDKKKREGLVVEATNTSRIIVIHEFYYVFLSVSDLSQYVIWVRGPQRSPLDWAVKYVCCWVGRMSLAYFQEKKIDGLVVQLNEDTVQVACWLLDQ